MRDTHRGMNISEAEYMAAIDDILAGMRKHALDEQTQKDVLAIAYALKGEILHVKQGADFVSVLLGGWTRRARPGCRTR